MSEANFIDVGANPADRARNRATGAGLVDDPYPVYDRLRETGPVHAGAISRAFGVEGMPDSMIWSEREQFACYDWESVDAVLRDAQTFSSEWYEETLGRTIGPSMIQMGGTQHRRYRALVQPARSPGSASSASSCSRRSPAKRWTSGGNAGWRPRWGGFSMR